MQLIRRKDGNPQIVRDWITTRYALTTDQQGILNTLLESPQQHVVFPYTRENWEVGVYFAMHYMNRKKNICIITTKPDSVYMWIKQKLDHERYHFDPMRFHITTAGFGIRCTQPNMPLVGLHFDLALIDEQTSKNPYVLADYTIRFAHVSTVASNYDIVTGR